MSKQHFVEFMWLNSHTEHENPTLDETIVMHTQTNSKTFSLLLSVE